MLRRLHPDQPESFAFTPANMAWAQAQIAKFPPGRQASAIIPLLWRAQEQEGWLSRPAIEHVADMLGLARIRALEVATFYFMFQLAPVGRIAHVQVCGTTPCMLCGSEQLVELCRERISKRPHTLSADGNFSWEEVECLGACANAPMAQIGKDYYEDLTAERLGFLLDELAAGRVPPPGPQNGRYSSEPAGGLTSLTAHHEGRMPHNASVALALARGDTVARILGDEPARIVPQVQPPGAGTGKEPEPASDVPPDATGATVQEAPARKLARPDPVAGGAELHPGRKPVLMPAAPEGGGDDLTRIAGVGPAIAERLNAMGVFTFAQIAAWDDDEAAWVVAHLGAAGTRLEREGWRANVRDLANGPET